MVGKKFHGLKKVSRFEKSYFSTRLHGCTTRNELSSHGGTHPACLIPRNLCFHFFWIDTPGDNFVFCKLVHNIDGATANFCGRQEYYGSTAAHKIKRVSRGTGDTWSGLTTLRKKFQGGKIEPWNFLIFDPRNFLPKKSLQKNLERIPPEAWPYNTSTRCA